MITGAPEYWGNYTQCISDRFTSPINGCGYEATIIIVVLTVE